MTRVGRSLLLVLATALASVISVNAEPADSGQSSINVGPVQSGPLVSQGSAGFDSSGIAARANASSLPETGASGPDFTYVPVPDNLLVTTAWPPVVQGGAIIKPGTGFEAACPAGQTGYYVYDASGQPLGTVCVPTATAGSPNELALAEEASSHQPWPSLTVGVNPPTGLTGLSSWFWLTPSNVSMPSASATAGPLTVTVRASLIDVLWNFGDGSELDSGLSLGLAYPRQSTIGHVYQTDTYQRPGGDQVAATLRFGVWYSVNGGSWRFLGSKAKSYLLAYPVNQIQPEGVPASP